MALIIHFLLALVGTNLGLMVDGLPHTTTENPYSFTFEDSLGTFHAEAGHQESPVTGSYNYTAEDDWTHETKACIIGHNNWILDGIFTLSNCKARCEDEPRFFCRSVEYHSNSNRCVLSKATSSSSSYKPQCPSSGWEFTEKLGCGANFIFSGEYCLLYEENTHLTFPEAEVACAQLGGHLSYPTGNLTTWQNAVTAATIGEKFAWVGATRNKDLKWHWLNNEPIPARAWRDGGYGPCGWAGHRFTGLLSDGPCSKKWSLLCQATPIRQPTTNVAG